MRELVEQRTEMTRTHLRDESSMVSRDDLKLDSALHLPVEFTHLRDVPQSNVVNRCSAQRRIRRTAEGIHPKRDLRSEVAAVWEGDDARDDP